MTSSSSISESLVEREIVVCAGCGGVGKTTVAAALALAAARRGRRALVLTIDPARRLADALGIELLGNQPLSPESPASRGVWGESNRTNGPVVSPFEYSESKEH